MAKGLISEIGAAILDSGAVEVRDVDSGAEPFVYSTGNRGPGYVMIKGLVGQPSTLKFLTKNLAHKLLVEDAQFDFIEGNATGGMVPAWQLRNDYSDLIGREVPYCYLRGSRKEGGHGELITGDRNNPFIEKGMRALVVEELVNYAGTTTNAANEFRAAGYPVTHAACILFYNTPDSIARLKENGVNLVPLITLPEVLDVAEDLGKISKSAINSYRDFLQNPVLWQLDRGLLVPTDTAERAMKMGYDMVKVAPDRAIPLGAPKGKMNEGVEYWGLR